MMIMIYIRLYETLERIKTEGWTNGALRAFERSSAPYLKIEPPLGIDSSRPPDGDWAGIRRDQVARFEVVFPEVRHDPPEIPTNVLPVVYRVLRRHLELAAGLLEDIGTRFWKTATFYPEAQSGDRYLSDGEAYLFRFRDRFDRMIRTHPDLLRADIALWPPEDPFFFNKLRLYAWTFSRLSQGMKYAMDSARSLTERFGRSMNVESCFICSAVVGMICRWTSVNGWSGAWLMAGRDTAVERTMITIDVVQASPPQSWAGS